VIKDNSDIDMERLRAKLWRKRAEEDQESREEDRDNATMIHEGLEEPHFSICPTSATEENEQDMLTSQIILATEENARLQEKVKELTGQLDDLQETHLAVQSRSEDLDQKLQLERRRFYWQKNFYEKKIVELALGLPSVNGPSSSRNNVDPEALLAALSNSFYHETILDLVTEQEKKDGELKDIKNLYQEKIRKLEEHHENVVAELVDTNLLQQLMRAHEELVHDLLSGCEDGLFKEMKEEYLVECQTNVALKTTKGNTIWLKFQKLSSEKKGIIVAAVCIVTIATAGWASWGFIVWVWPRLILFAESITLNPTTLASWSTFLVECINSPQFQTFVLAWEQGQSLGTCLKPFLNTALLATALQMAPNLLSQLKNRRGRT